MPIVRRANVELDVRECELDTYLHKGFSVISEKGEVLIEAPPFDLTTLRNSYIKQKKQIKELETQLIDATNQIELLTAEIKNLKKKKQQQ